MFFFFNHHLLGHMLLHLLCTRAKSFQYVWFFATLWAVAHQAPLSMGLSRQEYWGGLPFSPPWDLSDPGIELGSPILQVDSLPSKSPGMPMFRKRTQKISYIFLWGFHEHSKSHQGAGWADHSPHGFLTQSSIRCGIIPPTHSTHAFWYLLGFKKKKPATKGEKGPCKAETCSFYQVSRIWGCLQFPPKCQ